ncbi:MAG: hypothetical protein WDA28_05660 [Castellaniella sp.]
MNDNKPDVLTLSHLIEIGAFIGMTKGHIVIERFCKAVEQGQTPDARDLQALAKALEPLRYPQTQAGDNARRDALAAFSNKLGLTKKQGRQQKDAQYRSQMTRPIVAFLRERERLIEQGQTPSYAKQKARQIAIDQEAEITGMEMSVSAFDKRCREWQREAETEVDLLKRLEAYLGKMPGK